jgi:DNA-3-methyladenine glycosylase
MLERPNLLLKAFFDREVTLVARELLGATLLVDGVGGIIVESEAYHPTDPASHSFRGPTPRNTSMFGPPGCAYVYRSYGIHWCLNFVCEDASAVLIRAIEPIAGLELMAGRRGLADPRQLASGPGKVCAALGVTRAHDGLPLDQPPFSLLPAKERPAIAVGPRIGITKAVDMPWRFGIAGSAFLSRKFAQPAVPSPARLR